MYKVALHSVPRSGSTWLGNIINSSPSVNYKYQPHFSYEFKDVINDNSSSNDIEEFFKKISTHQSEFLDQVLQKNQGLIANFEKNKTFTHIVYKEVRYHYLLPNMLEKVQDLKCVFLIRNPLAVLYSWMNAPKEFDKENWQIQDHWYDASLKNEDRKENFYGYKKWREALELFLDLKDKYPDRVIIVKYHDLLHNTEETICKLFEFLKIKWQDQTKQFIKLSQNTNNKNPYSVFKIKKKDKEWEKLPNDIIEQVKRDLEGTILEDYLF